MTLADFLRSPPRPIGRAGLAAGLALGAAAGALALHARTARAAAPPPSPEPDPEQAAPPIAPSPPVPSVEPGRSSPITSMPAVPPSDVRLPDQSRIDRLLATPLSKSERADLRSGPQIEVAPGFPAEHADRARAFVTAALRATLAIRFDAPMPVTNVTRTWDYLAAHIRRIEIHASAGNEFVNASADARTALVTVSGQGVALWDPPRWSTAFTPQGGLEAIGVGGIITTLMHEARHLESGLGHRCNGACTACGTDLYIRSNPLPGGGAVRDPSLAYGGADAVDAYTDLWLADHSGDWLSEAQRADKRSLWERARDSFCDDRAPQMFRMPGEKA